MPARPARPSPGPAKPLRATAGPAAPPAVPPHYARRRPPAARGPGRAATDRSDPPCSSGPPERLPLPCRRARRPAPARPGPRPAPGRVSPSAPVPPVPAETPSRPRHANAEWPLRQRSRPARRRQARGRRRTPRPPAPWRQRRYPPAPLSRNTPSPAMGCRPHWPALSHRSARPPCPNPGRPQPRASDKRKAGWPRALRPLDRLEYLP